MEFACVNVIQLSVRLKKLLIPTMSSTSGFANNPVIEDLIQSKALQWIPCLEITGIRSSQVDAVYFAISKQAHHEELMVHLGSSEECTPTLVSEFVRIY